MRRILNEEMQKILKILSFLVWKRGTQERERADGRRWLGLENRKCDLMDTCMRRYIGER